MRPGILVLAIALLASAPVVLADPFVSANLKFSADFPTPPVQKGPMDADTGAGGVVLSRVTTFTASTRIYVAAVKVYTYVQPAHLDPQQALTAARDTYLRLMHLSLGTSTVDIAAAHPTLQFTFEALSSVVHGEGSVVLVPADVPRIYVVTAEHSGNASGKEIRALDAFLASFTVTD